MNNDNDDDLDLELDDDFLDDFDDDLDIDFGDDDLDDDPLPPPSEIPIDDDFTVSENDDDLDWNDDDNDGDNDSVALGAQKESLFDKVNLSFNTVVISIAVIIGLIVLVAQILTGQPQNNGANRFVSAINMQGATDGAIFGERASKDSREQIEESKLNHSNAFLLNPDALDSLEGVITIESTEKNTAQTAEELEELTEKNLDDIQTIDDELSLFDTLLSDANMSEQETIKTIEKSATLIDTPVIEKHVIKNPVAEDIVAKDTIATNIPPPIINDDLATTNTAPKTTNDNIVNANSKATNSIEQDNERKALEKQLIALQSQLAENNRLLEEKEKIITDFAAKQQNKVIQSVINDSEKPKERPMQTQPEQLDTPSKKTTQKQSQTRRYRENTLWSIRSAQSGKAWVSKKDSDTILPVVLGDTLEGIGRITDIYYQHNQWIIMGTKGRITK